LQEMMRPHHRHQSKDIECVLPRRSIFKGSLRIVRRPILACCFSLIWSSSDLLCLCYH
jgi:hypothetical protein